MKKINLIRIINSLSLNTIFNIVILLSSGIPLILTTFLISSNFQHEKKIAEAENLNLKLAARESIQQLTKDVRSQLKIVSQNQDVIDVLSANSDVRVFIENRAFGRISEILQNPKLNIYWALFSAESAEPIFFSNKSNITIETVSAIGSSSVFLKDNDIYLKEEVRLDDQNLPGPNAVKRGFIIGRISFENLKKVVPDLKLLKNLSQAQGRDTLDFEIFERSVSKAFLVLTFFLMATSILVSICMGLILFRLKILNPIKLIAYKLQSNNSKSVKNEIVFLENAIESFMENLKIQEFERNEKEKLIATNLVASQVAHDIRSPLTALNIAISTVDKLPEDKRILIRNAIQRINDIANDLLSKGSSAQLQNGVNKISKNDGATEVMSVTMLSSLVDILVSEKRTQYRNKFGVQIVAELSKSYGLFTQISANEYKRVLSNLINNSVEALTNGVGKILVTLEKSDGMIKIEVVDNGRGIPDKIIGQLGIKGLSYGKEGTEAGFGLGIHHAIRFIESIGGKIHFSSKVEGLDGDSGTIVTMFIPKIHPPSWFVETVEIPINGKLIALDDDKSIHSIWQDRLKSISTNESSVSLVSFTSAENFRNWVNAQNVISEDLVFLIDYEFLGQKIVGLDLIEELGIQKNSILVSSRYNEKSVVERCNNLKVRIIPKAMAGLVPIEIIEKKDSVDAVLIDDDEIVHLTWKVSASENNKTFLGFRNHFDFLEQANFIHKHTPIVIDSNLENGIKGELIAKTIFDIGFTNIFVGTGASHLSFQKPTWIKAILGKNPEWQLLN